MRPGCFCERLGHPSGIDPKQDRCRAPAALSLDVEQGGIPAEQCRCERVPELLRLAVPNPRREQGPTPAAVELDRRAESHAVKAQHVNAMSRTAGT